jgi:hypothetical protein
VKFRPATTTASIVGVRRRRSRRLLLIGLFADPEYFGGTFGAGLFSAAAWPCSSSSCWRGRHHRLLVLRDLRHPSGDGARMASGCRRRTRSPVSTSPSTPRSPTTTPSGDGAGLVIDGSSGRGRTRDRPRQEHTTQLVTAVSSRSSSRR